MQLGQTGRWCIAQHLNWLMHKMLRDVANRDPCGVAASRLQH